MLHGERFNSYSHLAGLLMAVPANDWLMRKTVAQGDPGGVAGAVLFCLSVVVVYAASTLFHGTRGRIKAFWQRIDHCAIFLMIAGTTSPFLLAQATTWWEPTLCVAMWGMAFAGIRQEWQALSPTRAPLRFYLIMGWTGVGAALLASLRMQAEHVAFLLAGAVLYSVGTVFYRNRSGMRHAHGTWHMFVLAGTTCHYLAIAGLVG